MRGTKSTKNKLFRHIAAAAFTALITTAFVSCFPPGMTGGDSGGGTSTGTSGSLYVTINDSLVRTLNPGTSMEASSYVLTGRGPEDAEFTTETTGGPVEIPGLKIGSWTVTVEAMNDTDVLIANGSSATSVSAGKTSSLNIMVRPLEGHGTLDVTVNWNVADVAAPAIVAQLIPATGAAVDLTFTIGSGTATCVRADVPTGYHTLSIQLLDGGTSVMGAIEVARIAADQTTTGVFDFLDINPASGGVDVDVTPELGDPLQVTITGAETLVALGSSMTVTAGVTGYTGDVTYSWYLNGVFQERGTSFATPAGLLLGTYRLDLTAISADGQQAGSTYADFQVVESTTTSVTIAWDPNTEPDLAGYKVYWSTTSGSYDHSADAGAATEYTVPDLEIGQTYYFAVTAYDSEGMESPYSDELSWLAE